MDVSSLFNYCKVSDRISMGGQPSIHQFNMIKHAGIEVVVQLVVKEASYNPKDEAYHVREAGLEHDVMDISFTQPTPENVEQFMGIMKAHEGKKVYVHCAVGHCTSGLIAIYLMETENITFEEAKARVLADWHPTPAWNDLIQQVANAQV